MNELIIWGILTLIIAEILFIKFVDERNWVQQKIVFLFGGLVVSGFLWLVPYCYAFNCEGIAGNSGCVNYGIEFFFWYYGVGIVIILFFLLNWKIVKWKIKQKELKKKKRSNKE